MTSKNKIITNKCNHNNTSSRFTESSSKQLSIEKKIQNKNLKSMINQLPKTENMELNSNLFKRQIKSIDNFLAAGNNRLGFLLKPSRIHNNSDVFKRTFALKSATSNFPDNENNNSKKKPSDNYSYQRIEQFRELLKIKECVVDFIEKFSQGLTDIRLNNSTLSLEEIQKLVDLQRPFASTGFLSDDQPSLFVKPPFSYDTKKAFFDDKKSSSYRSSLNTFVVDSLKNPHILQELNYNHKNASPFKANPNFAKHMVALLQESADHLGLPTSFLQDEELFFYYFIKTLLHCDSLFDKNFVVESELIELLSNQFVDDFREDFKFYYVIYWLKNHLETYLSSKENKGIVLKVKKECNQFFSNFYTSLNTKQPKQFTLPFYEKDLNYIGLLTDFVDMVFSKVYKTRFPNIQKAKLTKQVNTYLESIRSQIEASWNSSYKYQLTDFMVLAFIHYINISLVDSLHLKNKVKDITVNGKKVDILNSVKDNYFATFTTKHNTGIRFIRTVDHLGRPILVLPDDCEHFKLNLTTFRLFQKRLPMISKPKSLPQCTEDSDVIFDHLTEKDMQDKEEFYSRIDTINAQPYSINKFATLTCNTKFVRKTVLGLIPSDNVEELNIIYNKLCEVERLDVNYKKRPHNYGDEDFDEDEAEEEGELEYDDDLKDYQHDFNNIINKLCDYLHENPEIDVGIFQDMYTKGLKPLDILKRPVMDDEEYITFESNEDMFMELLVMRNFIVSESNRWIDYISHICISDWLTNFDAFYLPKRLNTDTLELVADSPYFQHPIYKQFVQSAHKKAFTHKGVLMLQRAIARLLQIETTYPDDIDNAFTLNKPDEMELEEICRQLDPMQDSVGIVYFWLTVRRYMPPVPREDLITLTILLKEYNYYLRDYSYQSHLILDFYDCSEQFMPISLVCPLSMYSEEYKPTQDCVNIGSCEWLNEFKLIFDEAYFVLGKELDNYDVVPKNLCMPRLPDPRKNISIHYEDYHEIHYYMNDVRLAIMNSKFYHSWFNFELFDVSYEKVKYSLVNEQWPFDDALMEYFVRKFPKFNLPKFQEFVTYVFLKLLTDFVFTHFTSLYCLNHEVAQSATVFHFRTFENTNVVAYPKKQKVSFTPLTSYGITSSAFTLKYDVNSTITGLGKIKQTETSSLNIEKTSFDQPSDQHEFDYLVRFYKITHASFNRLFFSHMYKKRNTIVSMRFNQIGGHPNDIADSLDSVYSILHKLGYANYNPSNEMIVLNTNFYKLLSTSLFKKHSPNPSPEYMLIMDSVNHQLKTPDVLRKSSIIPHKFDQPSKRMMEESINKISDKYNKEDNNIAYHIRSHLKCTYFDFKKRRAFIGEGSAVELNKRPKFEYAEGEKPDRDDDDDDY